MAEDDDEAFGEGLQVELFHAETDREPGDTNWQGYGFDVHPQVFFISAFVIIAFIAVSLLFPDSAQSAYLEARTTIGDWFGWLFIMAANLFIIFMVYLAVSKFGKIRIGGVDADKEFSDISWVAMLFSAGMGIGLMFFGVAEPIWHLNFPHLGAEANTAMGGEVGMAVSLFHWGFHPWAIYALVGLSLAFFSFNRGLPLTFRSIFWPVLGERIYGWPGHIIDILTVFATLFGLVTSLGLGALQINAGLTFLGSNVGAAPAIPASSIPLQVGIIAFVTLIAVFSVAAGLDGGVRRLSNLNLALMLGLLTAVIALGPTLFILGLLPQAIGAYFANFFDLSFYAGTLGAGAAYPYAGFLNDWTVFYWAWWIAWSPFVGMFIARISKGRTVREFIGGVLVLPVLFSFVWFATMGGTALNMELGSNAGAIAGPMIEDGGGSEVAMFAMFSEMGGTLILSAVSILLVATFFITSSDSGSLVIDHLTSGGKHDAPVTMRIFWASTEGVVAAALLVAGGENALNALQAAAISSGLPFVFILLFMMYAIWRGLTTELQVLESEEFQERVEEMAEDGEIVVDRQGGEVVTDISPGDEPGD